MSILSAISLARRGQSVLIAMPDLAEAEALLTQIADVIDPADVEHVRRVSGQAAIRFASGGRILFRSTGRPAGESLRGRTFDLVVTHAGASDDFLLSAAVATNGSAVRHPVLIEASRPAF